jgi:hypothetical protein
MIDTSIGRGNAKVNPFTSLARPFESRIAEIGVTEAIPARSTREEAAMTSHQSLLRRKSPDFRRLKPGFAELGLEGDVVDAARLGGVQGGTRGVERLDRREVRVQRNHAARYG